MKLSEFDNRNMAIKGGDRLSAMKEQHHFMFEFSGKKIVYCYIRKNACSAFKKLIVQLSDTEPKPSIRQGRLKFMLKNHRCDSLEQIEEADHVIFVYRDPVERTISLFLNKFVQQKGHTDIFRSYGHVTGNDPATATFSDFVNAYLSADTDSLDVHVRPQRDHLLPVRYTAAISLIHLGESMEAILDRKTAKQYFSQRANSTSAGASEYRKPGAYAITAEELRVSWLAERMLPTKESLIAGDNLIRQRLEAIYSQDKIFADAPLQAPD